MTANIFGDKKVLTLDEIIKFRRNIICDLYEFEFLMFPIQDGCIDGVDFARSIVKYVEPSKTRKFMKRVKGLKDIENIRIDKEAYLGFHIFMQTNIRALENELNTKGAINKHEFARMIN